MTAIEDERLALASWTRLAEPGDTVARRMIDHYGAVQALAYATGQDEWPRHESSPALTASSVKGALERWAPRVGSLNPERDLHTIDRLGGRFIIPSDAGWPALEALDQPPYGLWVRGHRSIPGVARNLAVIGSRDSTNYGNQITGDIAFNMAGRGYTIVSGGAYGIDTQAHRSALAAVDPGTHSVPTMAVLAGGLDRYYPAGNADLLKEVGERGLLISELPPGAAPTRWRFLQRNRVIAALSAVTLVVEARWRSGSMSTVNHALEIGRRVGAVPGSVYSANSAGTHKILAERKASLVTDADSVAELMTTFSL